MEYQLIKLLVAELGYAKVLKIINQVCNEFGIEILWTPQQYKPK